MKYDASLIETSTITVGGKKIPFQRIPAGMNGPNGPIMVPGNLDNEETEVSETERITGDKDLAKELEYYVNEGLEPDSDEVRAIKEEIEREHSEELLELVDTDETEVEEE